MRTILHSDLNNFFASVEMAANPELKSVPMAVCGDEKERHGIVLAKNEIAKALGIKTAMTIHEAQSICPNLVKVQADLQKYRYYSTVVRKIYEEYTDKIEPFGIDEAWLDVTHSQMLFGGGVEIAKNISKKVREKTGLTVSIGVSFNKVFAKLASDMKKPDGITEISFENYKEIVWKLPIKELLFVGKSTVCELNRCNIFTIGDFANCNRDFVYQNFGKNGLTTLKYANGEDDSPVKASTEERIKSVSNSTTSSSDFYCFEEIRPTLYELVESVCFRGIKQGLLYPKTITLWVRDNELQSFTRQKKLTYPTVIVSEIFNEITKLFKDNYVWNKPVRSVGVGLTDFENDAIQLDDLVDERVMVKKMFAQDCFSKIKDEQGENVIANGIVAKKLYQIKEKNNKE